MSGQITPKFRQFLQDIKSADYKLTVGVIEKWGGAFSYKLIGKIIYESADRGLIKQYVDEYLNAKVEPEAFA